MKSKGDEILECFLTLNDRCRLREILRIYELLGYRTYKNHESLRISVLRGLATLKTKGLIAVDDSKVYRTYRLTDAGIQYLGVEKAMDILRKEIIYKFPMVRIM